MINFYKEEERVLLFYDGAYGDATWIEDSLEEHGQVTIAKTFTFTKNDVINEPSNYDEPAVFQAATLEEDYYRFPGRTLSVDSDVYIHKDITLKRNKFIAERSISIFGKLDKVTQGPIYIGGKRNDAIPKSTYEHLVKNFPNKHELDKYTSARISSTISSYIETKDDFEEDFHRYMNKKQSRVGNDLHSSLSEFETTKYERILKKLQGMLNQEQTYSEKQWQKEIIQIILLLYPKYLYVFSESPVKDFYKNKNRSIDYLLVDSSGYTDIIEIKKPFDKSIITERTYRDNHIPLRELTGTIMQIEKYIFHLNKWGIKGEQKLTERFRSELPKDFQIKITNPGAIIIMGRTKGMSNEQNQDFEIIRRKFKNVIDILTYDDLIDRLKFTIAQWKKRIPDQRTRAQH
ncbi:MULTISPECIES: Shedu immune nuclease family protein [unclassified Guyparkeria]|uniref:Shedu immune nuclease family protein n=1 Tax=unclassified Guyparkeria TaxID=2626246 RepID=UPI0007339FD2|nr:MULTISPECIES: Shedu immune nuclease family protein [unclassified Guyparkeria]KTG16740.1 hypothetical protein AUR63_01355 [Guyparkeria sp. XI15]OAE85774.1 hypothetical protein AWR35_01355 [Guyparkeria sp. WRN-7]